MFERLCPFLPQSQLGFYGHHTQPVQGADFTTKWDLAGQHRRIADRACDGPRTISLLGVEQRPYADGERLSSTQCNLCRANSAGCEMRVFEAMRAGDTLPALTNFNIYRKGLAARLLSLWHMFTEDNQPRNCI